MDEKKDQSPQQTVINLDTVTGSTYAQVVNVTVTDIDVTLEFAFVHPQVPTKGQVVARVTLPKEMGLKLPELILTVNKFHENKKKGVKND